MSYIISIIKSVNTFLWNGPMLFLLFGTHIYFTFKLKFVQKRIFRAVRLSIKPLNSDSVGNRHSPSPFSALSTTLAATLGTGNIVGISAAIACGGPGAVFWCWLTGILGMATTYAECYLGIRFRVRNKDGTYSGGPMYALQNGLHSRPLAVLFCIATLIASCGMGCSTQARTAAEALSTQFGIPPYLTGIVLAAIVGAVIAGGINSIGKICTKLVPFMAFFYIGSCLLLLIINITYLLPAIRIIFLAAFTPQAVAGGLIGGSLKSAVRFGVARGLFTNEAGLGTAAIAAADVDCPAEYQSLVSMSATFWDTVVMCAITGIVIVSALLASPASLIGYSGNELTTVAFLRLGSAGTVLLTLSLCGFAAATLIGWSWFADRAAFFLYGKKGVSIYHFIYIMMIFTGSIIPPSYIWELSDLANALMAVPNLTSLILLRRHVAAGSKTTYP